MRDLAQRGSAAGERGGYISMGEGAEVAVPATVQAAIEARIDRLDTESQAHVERGVGRRRPVWHGPAGVLGIDAALDEL